MRVQKQEAESKDNQDEINPKRDRLKGNKTKQKNQKQNKQKLGGERRDCFTRDRQKGPIDRCQFSDVFNGVMKYMCLKKANDTVSTVPWMKTKL